MRSPGIFAVAVIVTAIACTAPPASPAKPRTPVVTVTDGAVDLLRTYAGERRLEDLHVRVAVTPEGDAFRYFIDFDDPRDTDVTYAWKGVRFVVDPDSAPYLHGAVVDVGRAEGGGIAFRFENPNDLDPSVRAEPGKMPPPVRLEKAY